MDTFEPYDPEDLETLLREKSFDDLLPEEQAFALKHIASKEEYDALREVYLHLHTGQAGSLEPSERLTVNVMADFRAKHAVKEKSAPWWSWFFAVEPWFSPRNRGMRLAFATLLLLFVAVPFFLRDETPVLLAENKVKTEEELKSAAEDNLLKDSLDSAEKPESELAAKPQEITQAESLSELKTVVEDAIVPDDLAEEERATDVGAATEDIALSEKNTRSESIQSTFSSGQSIQTDNVQITPSATTVRLQDLSVSDKKKEGKATANAAVPATAAEKESKDDAQTASTARQWEKLLKKCTVTR